MTEPPTTNRNAFKGAIAELGSHVYTLGDLRQADRYVKSTEMLTLYVGRLYGKKMANLMKGKEWTPTPPPKPTDSEGVQTRNTLVDPFDLEAYKHDYQQYKKELREYDDHKSKVFIIIRGQCALSMATHLETLSEYNALEVQDDVIGLLALLKKLTHGGATVRYEYLAMVESLRTLLTTTQDPTKPISSHYNTWYAAVEVFEATYGTLKPKQIGNDTEDEARGKFLACAFLTSVSKKKFPSSSGRGSVVDELSNLHLAKPNVFPTTPEGALNYLSNRANTTGAPAPSPRPPNPPSNPGTTRNPSGNFHQSTTAPSTPPDSQITYGWHGGIVTELPQHRRPSG